MTATDTEIRIKGMESLIAAPDANPLLKRFFRRAREQKKLKEMQKIVNKKFKQEKQA